ncbi:trypsin-like peptidase domain-containing protein [Kitasatospora sp. NPDC056327]|uniref:trypsin-like peptidase domain-containing protein n=1 Tax=Kitasatospora sp. NPDC056327 TaxID=3345785 RepID=UPI0035DD39FD
MSATAPLGLAGAEALRACAVMVEVAGEFAGCGFLVAPGLAVTAAHVLLDARRDSSEVVLRHASGARTVPAGGVRLFPESGDGTLFHPFPDLALLPVPGWTGHPTVRLATGGAEPDTRLTAIGFSTETPDQGTARPDTLVLRVVGPAADYVRVSGDGIRKGHSGSLLADPDGLVRGVLKGSRSYDADEGGWYTPAAALAAVLDRAGIAFGSAAPPAGPPPTDGELVTVLMTFGILQNSAGRFAMLTAMGRILGLPYPFGADEHADARLHLHAIVTRCRSFWTERANPWEESNALRAIVDALAELAPEDQALRKLRPLVERAVGGRGTA